MEPNQQTYINKMPAKIKKSFNWFILFVLLMAIAAIGTTGYLAYGMIKSAGSTIAKDVPKPVEINSEVDLDKANLMLKDITFDNPDLTNLEKELDNL